MAYVRDNPATTLGVVLVFVLWSYTLLTATNVLLGLVLPVVLVLPAARYVDRDSDDGPDRERPRK